MTYKIVEVILPAANPMPFPDFNDYTQMVKLAKKLKMTRVAEDAKYAARNIKNKYRESNKIYKRKYLVRECQGKSYKVSIDNTYPLKEALKNIQDSIRFDRKDRKRIHLDYVYGDNKFKKCKNVFVEPGQIVKVLATRKKKKKIEQVLTHKRPTDSKNYVGIELEFISSFDREELAEMVCDAELGEFVTLRGDGSIRTDEKRGHAHEANVLVSEDQLTDVVTRLTTLLNGKGNAAVNKSCGMHVHLDMRQRDVNVAYNNLVSIQPMLYAMQPQSRRENEFCKPTRGKVFKGETDCRYRGVNPNAYRKFTTLEVRIHSGTMDAMKILSWIAILIKAADAPKIVRMSKKLKSFARVLGLTAELTDYIKARVLNFNSDATEILGESRLSEVVQVAEESELQAA